METKYIKATLVLKEWTYKDMANHLNMNYETFRYKMKKGNFYVDALVTMSEILGADVKYLIQGDK